MGLIKLKMATAVVLVACTVGFGAFVPGAGGDQKPGAGGGANQPPARPAAKAEPPAKPPAATDRDRLQGTWRVVSLAENATDGGTLTPTNPKDPWVIEVTGGSLVMPYREPDGWKQKTYAFGLDDTKAVKTIDLIQANKAVGRGIYEFVAPAKTCTDCHASPFKPNVALRDFVGICGPGLKTTDVGVRLALSIDGKRPNKFSDPGVIVFELRRPADKPPAPRADLARQELDALRAELEQAMKNKLDKAALDRLRARLEVAEKLLEEEAKPPATPAQDLRAASFEAQRAAVLLREAQMRLEEATAIAHRARAQMAHAEAELAAAQKRFEDAKKAADANRPKVAPADAPTFAIHVRSLTAAEKVTRVKLTGADTVLDALTHADGVTLKPDAVSVWVVRDGAVLPVDLPGIVVHGKTTTNYMIKAGDALFVQFKPAK